MANLTTVPFHGGTIEATQDERGVWISVRRVCTVENVGRTRRTNVIALDGADARAQGAKLLGVTAYQVIVVPVRIFGGG